MDTVANATNVTVDRKRKGGYNESRRFQRGICKAKFSPVILGYVREGMKVSALISCWQSEHGQDDS